jgi:fructokinase
MSGSGVVSIGEALVDMIQLEDSEQPTYLAAWGGSPFNVAVGAARLGSTTEFAGSFADDALGKQLQGFLAEQGVGLDLSVTVDAQTTIAMTSFVNHEPRYNFYANPASYGFVPPAIGARQQVASASVIHAGSLGVLEDMTNEAICQAFDAASGVKTFDPNVRPRMVSDWANYRERLGHLIHQADFIKFSVEDIEATYPDQTVDQIALAALDGRAQAVLVTRAGDPATLYTPSAQSTIPIASGFTLMDTTGGGDATMAGMLHQLNQSGVPGSHDGWEHYVRQALIVAAIVCSRRGGAIAMPTGNEARAAGAQL